ncbi:MAG: hypothetical protein KDK91_08640 [Gammaproteobacteria bacterium]|nr:hypothetical protein [Gammaproteobacteria bacterium]
MSDRELSKQGAGKQVTHDSFAELTMRDQAIGRDPATGRDSAGGLSAQQLKSARAWCERMLRSLGGGDGGTRPADITIYGLDREYSCQDVSDALILRGTR